MGRAVRIHTIGYQQRDAADFVKALVGARVELLVDVRAVPMSRKPDFRKARLTEYLRAVGIRYLGLPGLGTPKQLRDKLATDGNYDEFFERFGHHLRSVREHLDSLAKLTVKRRVALMCFERDANECHRLVVAKRVSKLVDSPVLHL